MTMMRSARIALCCAAALACRADDAKPGMGWAQARHLLARTGFGAGPEEIDRLAAQDYEKAVDALLAGTRAEAKTPPPAWMQDPPESFRGPGRKATPEEHKAFNEKQRQQWMELKAWWYREMIQTDSPLTERMTLFWHNHFTSSLQKVKFPPLMYDQNALLRRQALGNFKDLLHAVARDPAMVLYLDSQTNRKGQPNENFARELLELFTLGEGHYTEQDIKQAARAFTGWMVDQKDGTFRFNVHQHDSGEKTFLGRTGKFDGDDILDILLEQPRLSEYVTTRLWKEFISDTPDPKEVQRLAKAFREGHYEIKPLVKGLLLSQAFRDPAIRGAQTKSPVDLIVGTVRTFGVPLKDTQDLAKYGRQLGQDLFDPPNVKGWPGGTAWINASTLMIRQQLLQNALRGRDMEAGMAMMKDVPIDILRQTLLPVPPVGETPDAVHMVLDPAYQLK